MQWKLEINEKPPLAGYPGTSVPTQVTPPGPIALARYLNVPQEKQDFLMRYFLF